MRGYRKSRGFTLIEILFVLVIFSLVMAGLYSSYSVLLKQGVREYRVAESEMDVVIARNIIERDLSMAGYGLAQDYDFDDPQDGIQNFTPMAASATEGALGNPDTLTVRGTAVATLSRSSQAWSHLITAATASFNRWNDARESLRNNDVVVVMESNTKTLWAEDGAWLFKMNGTPPNAITHLDGSPINDLVTLIEGQYLIYGLYTAGSGTDANRPYYAVRYFLGGTSPSTCAPGTQSLLRAESRTSEDASDAVGQPILNCVLDLQVAFGLDPSEKNKAISFWDNGGVLAQGYTDTKTLRRRLKQIRMYVLVQQGSRDPGYTYSNSDPDPDYYGGNTIRVGELSLVGGAVGQDISITGDLSNYRWRVVSFVVTPRNIR